MRDTWERCLAALCAWREARSEGIEGMRAVLHVINNRHKESGQSWAEEIAKKNQFSAMTVLGDSQTVVYPKETDQLFDSAMALAFLIYSQCDPDPTNGATFYWNPKTATSKWFRDNIANNPLYEISYQSKNHDFYRKVS